MVWPNKRTQYRIPRINLRIISLQFDYFVLTYEESVDDSTRKIEPTLSIFPMSIFETCCIVAGIMHLFNSSNSITIVIDQPKPIRTGLASTRRWTDVLIAWQCWRLQNSFIYTTWDDGIEINKLFKKRKPHLQVIKSKCPPNPSSYLTIAYNVNEVYRGHLSPQHHNDEKSALEDHFICRRWLSDPW